jgi:hypothetical protein
MHVKILQQKLTDRGFPCPVTGVATRETTTAWKAFLESRSMALDTPFPRFQEQAPYFLLHGVEFTVEP